MTRRKFIIGLLILLITIPAGVILVIPFETVVGKILHKQLGYLNLNEEAINSFVKDIKASDYYNKKNFGWQKQLFVRGFYLIDFSWLPLPGKDRYQRYCTFFVSDFLLSTDFFLNKMDESKEVNYLVLYEPYKRPCVNPFSNLFYPSV